MSIRVFALRHAATPWNAEKRLQGRRDIELSPAGWEQLATRMIPAAYRNWALICSPLKRAQQTATGLDATISKQEPLLVEMDWGDWEGQRLPELRDRLGEAMKKEEARGLDMTPPGGESPRQVRHRVRRWLESLPEGAEQTIITHKGVLRAMLSDALDWDMKNDCPVNIDWKQGLLFSWQKETGLQLLEYNIPLTDS